MEEEGKAAEPGWQCLPSPLPRLWHVPELQNLVHALDVPGQGPARSTRGSPSVIIGTLRDPTHAPALCIHRSGQPN